MPKLVFLGTATNIPDEKHENTHMLLLTDKRMVLIDGPGNPYSRIKKAGLDVDLLSDIVLTHFHPDHVSGVALLLMALGLSGRNKPLDIYTNAHCLNFMKQLLEFYEWEKWHHFPVTFHTAPEEELTLLFKDEEMAVYSSPVNHFVPALGLRIEFNHARKIVAYSGDTAPTPSLYGLAKNADVLIHEAGGASAGHSSALQAGELACEAKVEELYLVHYPVGGFPYHTLVDEAKQAFDGPVFMAEDFWEIEF